MNREIGIHRVDRKNLPETRDRDPCNLFSSRSVCTTLSIVRHWCPQVRGPLPDISVHDIRGDRVDSHVRPHQRRDGRAFHDVDVRNVVPEIHELPVAEERTVGAAGVSACQSVPAEESYGEADNGGAQSERYWNNQVKTSGHSTFVFHMIGQVRDLMDFLTTESLSSRLYLIFTLVTLTSGSHFLSADKRGKKNRLDGIAVLHLAIETWTNNVQNE